MILQPEDSELTRRAEKRTAEDGLYYIQWKDFKFPSNNTFTHANFSDLHDFNDVHYFLLMYVLS